MRRCVLQAQAIKGISKNVVRSNPFQMPCCRIFRGKEPVARLAILVIILEPIAQFWMNGNLAVDGIFLLQPDHLQDVSDATTFGEQLIRLQSYNLADPQASVDSESENRLIARVAQHTKYVGDFFRRKN